MTGEQLRELRLALSMSQRKFAELVGLEIVLSQELRVDRRR